MKNLILGGRSKEKEILDLGPAHYQIEEYNNCQKILFKINYLLGIFRTTVNFLKSLPSCYEVLDVGCGGGELIIRLSQEFPDTHFTGCDISVDAINLATLTHECNPTFNTSFDLLKQDSLSYDEKSFDVVIANLVCHHIEDEHLIDFFQSALFTSRKAVLVNDLHRHWIPYVFYRVFSPLFKNRLISHDGLISIRRSFKKQDWLRILQRAQITNYTLKWHFPFRWRLILWKS